MNKDLFFEYLWWKLARDPDQKTTIWLELKNKSPKVKKDIKLYIDNNLLIPPFKNKDKLINSLVSLWRKYYIGSLELFPKPENQTKFEYDLFKSYNMIFNELSRKYHLARNPFDYKKALSRINERTIITGSVKDIEVPFEAQKNVYHFMKNKNAILIGFNNSGHGAIGNNISFIMKLIKSYLNIPKKEIISLIKTNKHVAIYK